MRAVNYLLGSYEVCSIKVGNNLRISWGQEFTHRNRGERGWPLDCLWVRTRLEPDRVLVHTVLCAKATLNIFSACRRLRVSLEWVSSCICFVQVRGERGLLPAIIPR